MYFVEDHRFVDGLEVECMRMKGTKDDLIVSTTNFGIMIRITS